MRFLSYESLRVILLNTKQQLIKVVSISQGTLSEALSHPREIFKPVIVFSVHAFVLVHNHPGGDPSPSEADLRFTRRMVEASRILQLQLIDHVIIDSPAPGRSSYFSFKQREASFYDTAHMSLLFRLCLCVRNLLTFLPNDSTP